MSFFGTSGWLHWVCIQTSTGTRLMHRVVEKMGAAAVDEEDELLGLGSDV